MYVKINNYPYKVYKREGKYFIMKNKHYQKVNKQKIKYGSPSGSAKRHEKPVRANLKSMVKNDKILKKKVQDLKNVVHLLSTGGLDPKAITQSEFDEIVRAKNEAVRALEEHRKTCGKAVSSTISKTCLQADCQKFVNEANTISQAQIAKLDVTIKTLSDNLNNSNAEANRFAAESRDCTNRERVLETKITSLNAQIDSLNQQLNTLKSTSSVDQKVKDLTAQLEQQTLDFNKKLETQDAEFAKVYKQKQIECTLTQEEAEEAMAQLKQEFEETLEERRILFETQLQQKEQQFSDELRGKLSIQEASFQQIKNQPETNARLQLQQCQKDYKEEITQLQGELNRLRALLSATSGGAPGATSSTSTPGLAAAASGVGQQGGAAAASGVGQQGGAAANLGQQGGTGTSSSAPLSAPGISNGAAAASPDYSTKFWSNIQKSEDKQQKFPGIEKLNNQQEFKNFLIQNWPSSSNDEAKINTSNLLSWIYTFNKCHPNNAYEIQKDDTPSSNVKLFLQHLNKVYNHSTDQTLNTTRNFKYQYY